MKLIFTDYIASLKEEKELDSLIEDILREYDFEIVFSPKKGVRQYGVDIYAVGTDWKDGIKKLFLITVKQGNLDRKNWENGPQALQPSLQNITTVFVRNNILPAHKNLPIKILVAHNGENDSAIQQNFVGFADLNPNYEFDIWQLETLVSLVQEKLINENVFSDKAKRALRKIVINVSNPDYDFADYIFLLAEIVNQIEFKKSSKKQNLKQLRKINLINTIVISYCEYENDLRLGLKLSEITSLQMWKIINENGNVSDVDYFNEFFKTLITRHDLLHKYLNKILPICYIKDGLSKHSHDSVTYSLAVYEHLGLIALSGLEFLQFAELYSTKSPEIATMLINYAKECVNGIIGVFNNNVIVFSPRADDQIIEINLCFLLLFKFEKNDDIKTLLLEFNEGIARAKMFSNVAPSFNNSIDEIYELDIDINKRKKHDYKSSCLLLILTEWALVINDAEVYQNFFELKNRLFKDIDLILWFPDNETEKNLYTECAYPNTGYSLSNIELLDSFEDFKQITLTEYVNNCEEANYYFIKENLWIIGLIASRHYRTYIFPYYWRSLIINQSASQSVRI
ncbi:hypothetical protein EFY79_02535 [Hanamia caeni]|uniref:Uncharacterized protein n=1 Tax=Hanamia caeni TaxID=2294116 RepID=A0A3M9NQU7_9BACT|nr:hypothetical protein [Hanamia caeni]RNI40192.1 hypothetical protein EFY79_02535 [Hanamia caeni]